MFDSGDHLETRTFSSDGTRTWYLQSSGSAGVAIDDQARSSGGRPYEGSLVREDAGELEVARTIATNTATHATTHGQPFLTLLERALASPVVRVPGVFMDAA